MKDNLTRMIFVGVLGMALGGAALTVPPAAWSDEIKTDTASSESSVPNATYDESQPGADDPRVKEGFAVYKIGDFKKAYDIWLPLAEAGNAEAQFRVGRLYSFGEGREVNTEKSVRWYERAVLKGHVFANYNLGMLYLRGELVPENYLKALIFLEYSAENGHPKSQRALGILYAIDSGEIRDNILAYKWLHIALNNGDQDAIGAISKLKSYATKEEFEAGIDLMREWFKNHPRTQ